MPVLWNPPGRGYLITQKKYKTTKKQARTCRICGASFYTEKYNDTCPSCQTFIDAKREQEGR